MSACPATDSKEVNMPDKRKGYMEQNVERIGRAAREGYKAAGWPGAAVNAHRETRRISREQNAYPAPDDRRRRDHYAKERGE